MVSHRDGYRVIAERENKTYHQVRKEAIANGTDRLRVRRTDGCECPGSNADRHLRAEQVRQLRSAGATIRAIARQLGCSTYTVQRDLEPDGGKAFRRGRRRRGRHNTTSSTICDVGHSYTVIAWRAAGRRCCIICNMHNTVDAV